MLLAVLVDGVARFRNGTRRQVGAARDVAVGVCDVNVNLFRFQQQLEQQSAGETRQ